MMAREEYIRVYRSDQPNATPSLTAGEIAANLVDGKFFVGGTNGSLISFNDITRSVASVAVGASSFTGAVSITNGSNVTISTANNRIAISASVAVGATGYTIVSGIGSGISSIAGNIYSINNLGVTSFNGSTGAVSYYPPFATASVTGVASFPASFFSVSNGVVSLSGAYASTLTGDTVGATGSLTANTVSGVRIIDARLATINSTGVASFDTNNFTVSNGAVSIKNNGVPNAALANSSITVSTLGPGLGGGGSVSLGNTVTLSNLGVTGISANTNSGITISGTTGQVVISNSGVTGIKVGNTTLNGNVSITNGTYSTVTVAGNQITVDLNASSIGGSFNVRDQYGVSDTVNLTETLTFTGSPAIAVSGSNNQLTFFNTGVTSFNGQTGAVSYYPPFATQSVTGVASFNSTDFGVVNGAVSSRGVTSIAVGASSFTGAVSITNGSNVTISTANNRIAINAVIGATGNTIVSGIAAGISSVAGNTIAINNLGVTSFNGSTGAVSYYPPFATQSVTGVASFNSIDFGVVNGAVSSRGVTSIAVGASSFTGAVSITNGSNITISTANNRITINAVIGATGNTIVSGIAAGVSSVAGNIVAVNNLGVTSFNGSTGAVSYYPPIASIGASGVASFRDEDFDVSITGAVSLDAIVAKTNIGQTFTALQTFSGGITGSTAHFRGAFVPQISSEQISLSGDGSGIYFSSGNNPAYQPYIGFPQRSTDQIDIVSGGLIRIGNPDSDYPGNDGAIIINNGVLSIQDINTINGAVRTVNQIGNNVTINGGLGIRADTGATTITINNLGVTSFNGSTGAVNYYPPFATASLTGVASFPASFFSVANGVVSLSGAYASTLTGDTVGATGSLTANTVSGVRVIDARLATASVTGVASFPASFFSVANGVVSLSGAYASTLTGDTVGATGSLTANTVSGVRVIDARLATINSTGVASFDTNNFTVNNGAVSIKVGGVTNAALANSSFVIRDGGNSTNSVSLGDILVITGGTGVVFKKTSEDNFEIYSNFTINGTPPVGNDFTVVTDGKLSIPLASYSVTGVASFPLADFGVSITGEVSLTGNVARKNTAQTFTGLQTFATGISATTGSTIVGHFFSKNDTLNSYITFPGYLGVAVQGYHYFRAGRSNGGTGEQFGEFRFGAPTADSIDNYASHWMSIGRNSNTSISPFLAVNGIISSKEQGSTAWDGANIVVLSRDDTVNSWAFTVQGTVSDENYFGINSFGGISSAAGATFRDSVHAPNVFAKNILNSIAVGASSFTGAVSITNGSNVTISTANNQITISSSFSVGATGDTVGATGALTANTVNGVKIIDARLADTSVTGVASFSSTNFNVANGAVSIKNNGVPNAALANSSITVSTLGPGLGGGGSVSLGNTVTLSNLGVTGISTNTNSGITISGTTGQVVISNSGVTGFRVGGTLLTGTPSLTNNSNITRSGINLIPSGQDIAVWNTGVTSLNGLTGARTLTGDGGAIRGVAGTAITARTGTPCGTTGVVGVKCGNAINVDASGLIYLASGNPCVDCQANNNQGACEGAGCYWCSCNSTCYCQGQASVCPNCFGTGEGFFSYLNSGFGASSDSSGALNYMYLDVDNLNNYTGSFTSKTNNYVVFFDSDEAGLVKTKKASLKTFFLNNLDTLIESKTTSQFSRTKGSDTIEFRAVLGSIQAGEEGLVKGATAFEYISKNTVASVDGCTGAIEITGTVNEVTVTTSCPTVTIGLPDNVQIPYLSVTGATFAGSVKINGNLGLQNGQNITSAVTTFNGASGAVSYYPAFASASVTGVASFDTASGLSAGATGHVRLVSIPNSSLANPSFTLRDEVGGTDTISLGDTLTITGGRGVDFIRTTTDTYEVRGVTATASVLGVASFNSSDFTIASGAVSLTNAARTNVANTFTALQTFSSGLTSQYLFASLALTFGDRISSITPQYFNIEGDRVTVMSVAGSLVQIGLTGAAGIVVNNDGEATIKMYGDVIGATGASFGGNVIANKFIGTIAGGSF